MASKACRVCMVFAIAVIASDFLFASQSPKPARLQKMEDKLTQAGFTVFFWGCFRMFSAFVGFTVNSNCQKPFQFFLCQEANRLGLQPQRRLRQFLLDEGPCLLSYHVRGTEFSFLAELDVGERHFEAIAGTTAEEAKKNAAVAALQALKIEKSTMASPAPVSSLPPRHLRGRFECEACEDEIKMKFLGPEDANIHRIGQRSHAKLKVINEKEKHFVITVAGTEKRFMKATYMLQELLAKFPKSKRPKASLVLD